MYLFFAGDNGGIHRAGMPIGNLAGSFGPTSTVITSNTTNDLFEAPQVHKPQGRNRYLMTVEAIGSQGRCFRSFTATGPNGPDATGRAWQRGPRPGKTDAGPAREPLRTVEQGPGAGPSTTRVAPSGRRA